jgi:mRNA interferase MazF
MLMVITSFPCWSRTQQIRLNTLVKFEPAEPLFGGQFSTGANIQADQFNEHTTVTVLPVTSTLVAAPLLRITVQPGTESGLQKPSQVMVDKAMTVKGDKVGPFFGRIDADTMIEVERCLAVFLGIAK